MSSEQRSRKLRHPLHGAVVLVLAVFAGPVPAQQAAQAGTVLEAAAVKALVADRVWTATGGSSGTPTPGTSCTSPAPLSGR